MIDTVKTSDFFRKPLAHFLIIILLGFLVYSATFKVPFVLDDRHVIIENPAVRDLGYFMVPAGISGKRFIGYLTFALNYKLHGLDVTGYHAFNLLVHLINALLVYLLVVFTFNTPWFSVDGLKDMSGMRHSRNRIALFTALLFVSHPVQTQAVTYISQRFASLATMFYLLSIVTYIKWRTIKQRAMSNEQHAKRYTLYAASLISAIFAMLTKEISFTLPVMIIIYEFMFFLGSVKKRIFYLIPLILTMLIIPVTLTGANGSLAGINSIGESIKAAGSENISSLAYLYTQFRVIVTYIRLLVLPINQNLDYDYHVYHSFFEPDVFLSFIFLLSIFALGIYLLYAKRYTLYASRFLAFGIAWFFVALAIESSIIPIIDVIFEHRVYLPSIGFFIALISAIEVIRIRLKNRIVFIDKAIVYGIVLLVTGLSVTAYARNSVWQDKVRLWKDTAEKSPGKARPHNSLGTAYEEEGLFDEAVTEYQVALKLNPDDALAHYNLGNTFFKQHRLDDAVTEYQAALKLNPDDALAHYNLGNTYFEQSRFDEAVTEYQAVLRLNPDYVQARYHLELLSKAMEHRQGQ